MPKPIPAESQPNADRVERIAYSPAQAAEAIGCSRKHIYTLIDQGILRPVKVGHLTRISADQLTALVSPDA
jgi:excisionase family DNA binding protein